MNTNTLIKTSTIAYSYLQAKSGKFAKRTMTCATKDVDMHIANLNDDSDAKNVRLVANH